MFGARCVNRVPVDRLRHQAIEEMKNMNEPILSDNRRVIQHKEWAEFFAIAVFDDPAGEHGYTVRVSRYCLPGRCDSYSFALCGRHDILHWSEGDTLVAGLKQLHQDLEKAQVIRMFEYCLKRPNGARALRRVQFLLESLAPKSKAVRFLRKTFNQPNSRKGE